MRQRQLQLLADRRSEHQRHQAERGSGCRHQNRHEAIERALQHYIIQRMARQSQLVVMAHQDDAVASGDAKQRDESNHRRHTHVGAGQVQRNDAANQGQRQVEHHDQRFAESSEGLVQKQQRAEQRQRTQSEQSTVGLLLALELAAVFDVVTGWQLEFCLHLFSGVGNH